LPLIACERYASPVNVSDQGVKHVPGLLREFRPHAGLLGDLEEHSEAYVLGPRHSTLWELSDAFGELIHASTPVEFDAELERLARDGAAAVLHALVLVREVPREPSASVAWPMVFKALRHVLAGDNAADRFLEGLMLLSLRTRFAVRAQTAAADGGARVVSPEVVDPEIWEHLFAAKKADVCMLAVISLLTQRNRARQWLGMMLAEQFYSGQAAGVRALASIFDDEQAEKALELAGQSRIDWGERFNRALSIERSLSALADKASESKGVHSPFGEGYDDP
jgi:hypothetical protein